MDNIIIEKAKKEDSDVILSCIKGLAAHVGQSDMVSATKESIENKIFFDNSHVEVLLAYLNKRPVGFILYYKTFSTFKSSFGIYVEDLFVFPKCRNRGIGTRLLQHVVSLAKKQDMCKVEWYVNNKNKEAITFYKKFDASILDYKSIYYINCHEA
jgi:ribosomal protein S18 acetylase RimI-like enzyme